MSKNYNPADFNQDDQTSDSNFEVLDSNGNKLTDGDSVHLIKDLDVKGSSMTLKRGTVIKNIKLVDDESEGVQCKIGKSTIMLNPAYLKKK
jgi:protein PhnA